MAIASLQITPSWSSYFFSVLKKTQVSIKATLLRFTAWSFQLCVTEEKTKTHLDYSYLTSLGSLVLLGKLIVFFCSTVFSQEDSVDTYVKTSTPALNSTHAISIYSL